MKKKNVLNLIKYYSENNDEAFRSEAYEIAREFDKSGDFQLSEYIMALLSNANTFVPQGDECELSYFIKIEPSNTALPLPEKIKDDINGIINAIHHNVGINKFLFEGAPGTGKTETVKQLARILKRDLFSVEFDTVIDSKLGQTSKNIAELFREINYLPHPERAIILFDEIDSIALNRLNSNDLREMGRATTSILKGLDNLNSKVVFIATTNLYNSFDKALLRRFDSIINFDRYSKEELIEVAEVILNEFLVNFKGLGRNMKLFKKILNSEKTLSYPGELKNIIKTAIAFSDPKNEYDYLKRLFYTINDNNVNLELKDLQDLGYTVREIEILTGISKSQVSRELKE
jgi:SpoVK/Ycf46/Vps4 family AAA+-type ATPase